MKEKKWEIGDSVETEENSTTESGHIKVEPFRGKIITIDESSMHPFEVEGCTKENKTKRTVWARRDAVKTISK